MLKEIIMGIVESYGMFVVYGVIYFIGIFIIIVVIYAFMKIFKIVKPDKTFGIHFVDFIKRFNMISMESGSPFLLNEVMQTTENDELIFRQELNDKTAIAFTANKENSEIKEFHTSSTDKTEFTILLSVLVSTINPYMYPNERKEITDNLKLTDDAFVNQKEILAIREDIYYQVNVREDGIITLLVTLMK